MSRYGVFDRGVFAVARRLAIAPVGPLALWIVPPSLAVRPIEDWPASALSVLIPVVTLSLLVAIFAVALGLPLYYLFRRLNWTSPILFASGGALIPASIFVLTALLPNESSFSFTVGGEYCEAVVSGVRSACGWAAFYGGLGRLLAFGAAAGFVFWLLLRKRVGEVPAG